MIERRPFARLGAFENDWLNSRFHFSFAEYHDPARMGFGALRVWNDDHIQPGKGFPMHGHRDMEILTYVRAGAVSHQDSLGNAGRTPSGSVQVMHAGTGILHTEWNAEAAPTALFQIWIEPSRIGVKPGWTMREFPTGTAQGRLVVLASGRAGDRGALPIHQDAALLCASLRRGEDVVHELGPRRRGYLVPARGALVLNGVALGARDGAAIADEARLSIRAIDDAEIVLVDLP